MKRPWRVAAILAILLGLLVCLRIGWSIAQERIAGWMGVEHSSAGWKWRVYGARRTGWRLLQADSIKASNASISLRLRFLRITWSRQSLPYPIAATVTATARSLDISLRPSVEKDTSAPAFPSSIWFPVEVEVALDSFRLGSTTGRDSGKNLLSIAGIRFASTSPFAAGVAIQRLEPAGLAMHAKAKADVDWTNGDTLRIRLAGLASSGCCEQDSLHVEASLYRRDLREGRFHLAASIESTRGWSELVPTLATAPAAHEISLDARGKTDLNHPQLEISLGFDSDSISFLPPMRLQLKGKMDSTRIRLGLDAVRDAKNVLHADLFAPVPKKGGLANAIATGEIRINELGWSLRGFEHPLNGNIHVQSLDRKGASVQIHTDAGSDIQASATWKGMHWNLAGQVAANEPWAVNWVNGLALEEGGSVIGHDSAHGAFFGVVARQPRMTNVVALDSLATRLWIGAGPHLVFSGIRGWGSGTTLVGSGDISIPDSLVRFELRPQSDSVALAEMEARFSGSIRISATSFPTKGLPLRLPFPLPFDGRVDGTLRHDPPRTDEKSVSWVEATLRAKPQADSLHLGVDLAIHDSSIHLPRIRLDIGSSSIDGSLAASAGTLGWGLDTLRLATEKLELASIAGLWPKIPSLKGRLRGYFLSQRGQSIQAQARLDAPEIAGEDRSIQLPDLLLWSGGDTVHLGGWYLLSGSRAPFQLSATHLWDPTPEFEFKAFWGDVVKLQAKGSIKDKKDLETSFRLIGSAQIPETEATLGDILLTGEFKGTKGPAGVDWNARAKGQRGVLTALAGNPLDLRFDVSADPKEVRIDQLSLSGAKNGRFDAAGFWNIPKKALTLSGQAVKFRLDLGPGKRLELDSLGIWATPDSRIRLQTRDVFWHQTFEQKGERLDVGLSRATLTLLQARDWKKLSGEITVDKLLFTKNFAQVGDLIQSLAGIGKKKKRVANASSGIPLLLDIQATSEGDDIRISNNLGRANLGFDLQVTGPTEAPLLNGFVAADPDSGEFGYLGRNFALDTLRIDWNTEPPLKGTFSLAGSRQVRQTCDDPQKTGTSTAELGYCSLTLSSQGSLENPRLSGLTTTDCSQDPSDDGTVGAFVALATDCYPQPDSKSDTRWGSVVRDGSIDLAYGYGMGWFNQIIMDRLRGSRDDAIWLPDSVLLTDVPVGGVRDQLGISALYHITPEFDLAGVYRHTFTQAGSTTSGSPVLADDYGLSLKYRIPFWWIEEERVRKRLVNRVFLQLDLNQGLDENSRRSTAVLPSLRYRWEFW